MEPSRWADIPSERITDQVARKTVWGEKATLARFSLTKGAHISRHKHEHEQYTTLLSGAMRMDLGGRELTLGAGDVLVIPPWVEHEVWVLEDTEVLDFFSPPRQDWREGKSQYLAGK